MTGAIIGIDHIGLATDDPAGVSVFLAALGMRKDDQGVAAAYGVSCEFWSYPSAGGQPALELVTPVDADSAISAHLSRHGPGLHHVAFEVTDVDAELARLCDNGFVAVDAAPCAGARPAMRVAFVYLRRPAGLLVELVQYGADGRVEPAVAIRD